MFSLKALVQRPLLVQQRRLAADRSAMDRSHFVEAVASTERGRSAATLLWDKLAEMVVCDDFTPYPDDDLLKVFGLAEEDLDEDVILEIINSTGSVVPSQEMLKEFGPVNTPADIVRLIEMSNSRGNPQGTGPSVE